MISTAKADKSDTVAVIIEARGNDSDKSIRLSCAIDGNYMTVIFTDIWNENWKEKERELEAERQRYKMLINLGGYIIFETNRAGKLVYKSSGFDRVLRGVPLGGDVFSAIRTSWALLDTEYEHLTYQLSELENGTINSFEEDLEIVDATGSTHFYRLIASNLKVRNNGKEEMHLLCMACNVDEEVRALDSWQSKATTDGLTGLLNKETFKSEVDRLIKEGNINSAYVVMSDVDNFKGVNDKLGHSIGDVVLKDIASCIISILTNDGDLAGRFGGDEYCMFLANRTYEEAVSVLEVLRKLVNKKYSNPENGEEVEVSISIGTVVYPNDGNKASLLISNADIALYEAKRAGKNKVTVYKGEESNAEL